MKSNPPSRSVSRNVLVEKEAEAAKREPIVLTDEQKEHNKLFMEKAYITVSHQFKASLLIFDFYSFLFKRHIKYFVKLLIIWI
jgi:hypothetical protein